MTGASSQGNNLEPAVRVLFNCLNDIAHMSRNVKEAKRGLVTWKWYRM